MNSRLNKQIFFFLILISFDCLALEVEDSNNDFFSKLKVICFFLIIFGFFSYVIKKWASGVRLPIKNYSNSPIVIKQKIVVSPTNSLVLAEVNNQTLLLSSSNTGLTILKEISPLTNSEEMNKEYKTNPNEIKQENTKVSIHTNKINNRCKLLNFKSVSFWKDRGQITR